MSPVYIQILGLFFLIDEKSQVKYLSLFLIILILNLEIHMKKKRDFDSENFLIV
jgi:hypothetical protein